MSTIQAEPPVAAGPPPARRAVSWKLAVVAGVVLAAHLPLLVLHARQIWMRPHYQFFPLVLLGAAVLAFARLRRFGSLSPAPPLRAGLFLAAAWVLLAAAELLYSSWLGAAAALVMTAAMLYAVGGARLFRAAAPAWLLLWLILPPPFELDRQLILWLQSVTARWASGVLDFLGQYHVMAGNVVEIGGRRLFVEEACSGVNSLFSALACTLFFVFLVRRPPVRAVLLLATTVGWVLASNVARVAGIAYLLGRWGVDLSEGWAHEALGAGLFVAVLALVWSTDRLLLFLAAPAATAPPKPAAGPAAPASADAGPRRPPRSVPAVWAFGVLYALLLLAHFGLYGAPAADAPAEGGPVAAAVERLDAASMPDQFERWQRLNYAPATRNPGSAFGENSRTWSYQAGPNTAALSLDYTFPAWHDLTRCYTGQGWTMDEQAVRKADGAAGAPADGCVAVKLSKPGYRSGYLLFCQFNRDGAPLEPRLGAAYLSLYRQEAALRRWLRLLQGGPDAAPPDPPGPVYQLQLFVESYAPLSASDQAAADALFLHALRSLRKQWRPDANPMPAATLRPRRPGDAPEGARAILDLNNTSKYID